MSAAIPMEPGPRDALAFRELARLAGAAGLELSGAAVRRTSSRFCLGVEHGDYNGTRLFGVGTDRFLWLAYRPSGSGRVRLFSGAFPADGVVEFELGSAPAPGAPEARRGWARFPFGVDYVLRRAGLPLARGIEGVLFSDIPGGGMSRSAALALNLLLTLLEVNALRLPDPFRLVELAQAVENDYIGSPCGLLDQTMILFARAGFGTLFDPAGRRVAHVPLGAGGNALRLVCLDTGTDRPGLEHSTYRIRRAECEQLARLAAEAGFPVRQLGDVKSEALYRAITARFRPDHPALCARLDYLFHAQVRFEELLGAWSAGAIETLGRLFRADGIGLRDDYCISGPELETMCDIARSVPGVLGERMLGGGDKGAAGALVRAEAVPALAEAVARAYPASRPSLAGKWAVHELRPVDGVCLFPGAL